MLYQCQIYFCCDLVISCVLFTDLHLASWERKSSLISDITKRAYFSHVMKILKVGDQSCYWGLWCHWLPIFLYFYLAFLRIHFLSYSHRTVSPYSYLSSLHIKTCTVGRQKWEWHGSTGSVLSIKVFLQPNPVISSYSHWPELCCMTILSSQEAGQYRFLVGLILSQKIKPKTFS